MNSNHLHVKANNSYVCSQLNGQLYEHVPTTYGVYRDCILNSFHFCDGLSPEIMHEILDKVGHIEFIVCMNDTICNQAAMII